MSSLRCRPRSPAEKTPLEDDDLLSEILLRLPPQPSSLPRASLVCKRWHDLASEPGFFHRFRRHHSRNPPLLGFFHFSVRSDNLSFVPTLKDPDRVPPGRFSLQRGDGDRFVSLGCRHGLVLIFDIKQNQLLVWDPVTGDQHRLAIPPGIAKYAEKTTINGAVLRVSPDTDFQVVLTVADNNDKQHRGALGCVYSAKTGLWGDLISTPVLRSDYRPAIVDVANPTLVFTGKPAVLARNSLHWMLAGNFVGILEFDLEKQSLAVIRVPVHMVESGQIWINRAEDGGLGLFFLPYSDNIQLWKRRTDCDGVASWALARTIELHKLLSVKPWRGVAATILGFAEENNVVFLWICGIVFMIDPESLQFKKLCETNFLSYYHPFESVYTAGVGDEHDAADLLHQT